MNFFSYCDLTVVEIERIIIFKDWRHVKMIKVIYQKVYRSGKPCTRIRSSEGVNILHSCSVVLYLCEVIL